MEVSPEYWENPETLKDIYVSTSGGAISGAQATGAVVSHARAAGGRRRRSGAGGAQPAHQPIAVARPRLGLDRRGGQHPPETMVPLSR